MSCVLGTVPGLRIQGVPCLTETKGLNGTGKDGYPGVTRGGSGHEAVRMSSGPQELGTPASRKVSPPRSSKQATDLSYHVFQSTEWCQDPAQLSLPEGDRAGHTADINPHC